MTKDLLTIGELAKKMNVSVRTLQFYDKEGILTAYQKSDGGRRLYTQKDVVRLHQILSLKYLGFSLEEIKTKLLTLDDPEEVVRILEAQRLLIHQQIKELQQISVALDSLAKEARFIKKVDFGKYADVVALMRQNNPNYWMVKLFDESLTSHMRERFENQPEEGLRIFNTYTSILDEVLALKEQGESPTGEKALALAKRWWDMIMDFTGGDMSLLPQIMSFNDEKQGWDEAFAVKQEQADPFIGEALDAYLEQQGIELPFEEVNQ